ncbi:hypothetical protein M9H77_22091 [Catharanthus roseus]|uniref:Uncharacterized protein n=1 Tax=Catharanthus roseus TaxID=4058 RepID=A0ACC0ATJ1_CATRO|nr:hypothetical protein M9H77_22091 [Catharanthus roseus]
MEEQLIQTVQFWKRHMPPRNMLQFFREQNVDCAVRYNMQLLEAIGMTPTDKNFTGATPFMQNRLNTYISKMPDSVLVGNEEDVNVNEPGCNYFENGKWFNACDL